MKSKEDNHPTSRFSDTRTLGEKTKFIINYCSNLVKSAGKYDMGPERRQ